MLIPRQISRYPANTLRRLNTRAKFITGAVIHALFPEKNVEIHRFEPAKKTLPRRARSSSRISSWLVKSATKKQSLSDRTITNRDKSTVIIDYTLFDASIVYPLRMPASDKEASR